MAGASAKKPVVEQCWTLVGEHRPPFWYARRVRPTRGKPQSVEFDAACVIEREEARGDIIGFYHTHPAGFSSPSARDDRTMWAWCSAFGKPLLCLIESDGDVHAFRYDDDAKWGVQLTACQRFPRGIVVALDADAMAGKMPAVGDKT